MNTDSRPENWRELVPEHIRRDIGTGVVRAALEFWRHGDPELQRKALRLAAEYEAARGRQ